jgi:predicted DCC family thiol-disulfide oxidoreductase YuxK
MAINTFEISGQLGKILGLSNVGVEWIERLEKLDQDTEIKYIKITLESLKENLKEINKEANKIDLYGDQE